MRKYVRSVLLLVVFITPLFVGGCGDTNVPPSAKSVNESETPEIRQQAEQPPAVITSSVGMQFARIPAGKFLMGSAPSDPGAREDEQPQHQVQISKPFFMGIHEVTQAEFEKLMGTNPSSFTRSGLLNNGPDNVTAAELPVDNVTWYEAIEFCRRLSELPSEQAAGRVYRLPTEAEWEYACRAGTKTLYHSGDNPEKLVSAAWYSGNSDEKPHPVGQKEPNNWGLYDMHGNVWEWCNDWYDENYYQQGTNLNPPGPEYGKFRVIRGGAWNYFPYPLRSSHRGFIKPVFFYNYIGFRVVSND